MKPRQTIKNYHNSNAPPYQHLQNSATPPSIRDIDLVKLGLNLDDIPNLQANNPNLSNQEEIVKCLQAIYGKTNAAATTTTKLPTLNDWPMQSVSPPDYSRVMSGGSGANFNNNSNNNNISSINNPGQHQKQQQQQDIHFTGSQQHSHPPPPPQPSSTKHHFRISNSNIHSSQQLQQQKSVLSLHNQHHQNGLSNRRLNHHHHQMSTTNATLANLSTASVSNATSTSNNSTSSLDTNNLSTLSGKISGGSTGSGGAGGVSMQIPNILDTLGTMDNMFYDGNMLINKEASTNQQQSLMKHQHLQKLLKATGSQLKSSSSSSSTLSHRNESTQPQSRNIISNNMPQTQLPISSPASAISPPQTAFTSVPKSLLNLAACSSSSPSTNTSSLPSASKFSSMVSQLNLMSARNANASNQANNNNNATSNSKSFSRNNNSNNNGINDGFNQKGPNGGDHSNLLQHMIRPNSSLVSNNGPPPSRSSSKPIQLSLLSEDQSSAHRSTPKTVCNVNSGSNNSKSQPGTSRLPNVSSKDAYLASLQERAARVGVSIGEIGKTTPSINHVQGSNITQNNNVTNPITQQQNTISISPNQTKDDYMNPADRKEIESALSRVEARNDLSLLYPPMLLASNSQKQINALSAGLEGTEDSELFTKEVKKIVLEECNIIYECKECNNLFRSLANLVKHKRTYCVENNSGRNSIEMNKRSYVNPILPMDQSTITFNSTGGVELGDPDMEVESQEHNASLVENRPNESSLLANNNCSVRNSDRRNNLSNMIRIIQNQEKKNQQQQRDITRLKGQNNGSTTTGGTSSAFQTSLSKLLQSQPKTRLPVSRDNALIGALNMTPISSNETPLSAFESDKNLNISSNDMNEQFVRNSSLAKTLLNEKVKATNNTKQPLSELSERVESSQPGTTRRAAPKRKFLEDCIQKVKRDKLLTQEEEEEDSANDQTMVPTTLSYSNTAITEATNLLQVNKDIQLNDQEAATTIASDTSKFNSPGDSDDDSDMLMIDLEGPMKKTPVKKGKRRISTAATSTASSSSPIKLNTSSALLKALTRPVDTKRPYNAASSSVANEVKSPPPYTKEPEGKLSPNQEETEAVVSPPHLEKPNEIVSPHQEESKKSSSSPHQKDPVESLSPRKEPEEKLPEEEIIPDPARPLFDMYTCDYCDLDLADPDEMLEHSLRMHSKMMIIFPCLFCSFSFISIENVCRHILEIHKKSRAQIQRLKDVVRSRSFESADFSACRDCPQTDLNDEDEGSDNGDEDEDDDDDDDNDNGRGHDGNVDVDDDDGSSSSSSQSSSNSSSTSSSSGSSSSSSSSAASSSSAKSSSSSSHSQKNSQPPLPTAKQLPVSEMPLSPTKSVLEDSQSFSDDESSPAQEKNVKQVIATKQTSSSNECGVSSPNHQDNDSYAESEGNDDDDSTSSQHHECDEQKPLTIIAEQAKQSTIQKPSPSSKSNPEPSTSSGSSAGGGIGGIMKLKIQLKTRPDEKSKVYEIV